MSIENTFSRTIGEFSLILVKQALLNQDSSTFYFSASPTSIFMALSMIHVGSRDSSCDELTKQLGVDFSIIFTSGELEQNHLVLLMRKFLEKMIRRSEIYSKIFTIMIMNQKNTSIQETVFKSTFEVLDFGKNRESIVKLNTWVSDCTQKRIPDLLSESNINIGIAFMLINVIFFKSEWKHSFNVDYSYIDKFHKKSGSDVEVKFMKQKGFVGVFDDEENRFQALCLDFKFNDLVGLFVQLSKDKTVHGLISIVQLSRQWDIVCRLKELR